MILSLFCFGFSDWQYLLLNSKLSQSTSVLCTFLLSGRCATKKKVVEKKSEALSAQSRPVLLLLAELSVNQRLRVWLHTPVTRHQHLSPDLTLEKEIHFTHLIVSQYRELWQFYWIAMVTVGKSGFYLSQCVSHCWGGCTVRLYRSTTGQNVVQKLFTSLKIWFVKHLTYILRVLCLPYRKRKLTHLDVHILHLKLSYPFIFDIIS